MLLKAYLNLISLVTLYHKLRCKEDSLTNFDITVNEVSDT